MKSKKRAKGNISKGFGILCFGIAMLINVIGIGYADYDNSITATTLVASGSIDPHINDCGVVYQSSKGDIRNLGIDKDGSTMNISINNAEPGYMAIIKYTVRNDGTIPISCRASSTKGAVDIYAPQSFQAIPGGGGIGTGIIQIYVNKRTGSMYNQPVRLYFSQYTKTAE